MKNPFGIPQAKNPEWFSMARNEADPTKGEIYVYDVIDPYWGVSAQGFAEALTALGDVTEIAMYVNSPGGAVSQALSMRAMLARHPAKITAYVDGMAASAASFLITGADEIVMSANSELMIHDASNYAYGNAAEMRSNAERLDRVSDNIAEMYAGRAGGEPADWRALMVAETWYSDKEAVEAGLADRIAEVPTKTAAPADGDNVFDLSVYAHAGRRAAPDPLRTAAVATARRKLVTERNYSPADADAKILASMVERRGDRPAEPGTTTTTNQEGVDHMADIIKGLRTRLGIKAEATLTDDQLLEAVDQALAERAEPVTNAVPEGTVLIDSAALEELRNAATLGATAHADLTAARRAGIVDKAIDEGRIPVARRDQYLALVNADEEGAVEVINSLAAGLVVNTKAKSYTGGVAEATDDDDTLFATFYGDDDTTKEN